MTSSLYDIGVETLDGRSISMDAYRGHVLLIVNTASRCGMTPQYAGLQRLHERYAERGLRVLGFPCNQFGAQEPGSADEIGEFCQNNYGVSFPMHAKIDVNGENAHPLYRHLKSQGDGRFGEPIAWNFTKFLVDADGRVVERYGSKQEPDSIAADIERLLA